MSIVLRLNSYQDRNLEKMNADDFELVLKPKIRGTMNLYESFDEGSLDFFVFLSSSSGILGIKTQANYAAGNTFQDRLAYSQDKSSTSYISLNLGLLEGQSAIVDRPELQRSLMREGLIPMTQSEVLTLLGYAMSGQARQDRYRQIAIGFNRRSLSSQEGLLTLRNPLFSHLPYDDDEADYESGVQAPQSVDANIASAKSLDEAHDIITKALTQKLSTLIALDRDEIGLDMPLGELGLDSLIAIELKNWIAGAFQATLQSSEILDASNLLQLAMTIAARSALMTSRDSSHLNKAERVDGQEHVAPNVASTTTSRELPPLPLPDLQSTLDLYLDSVRVLCSDREFKNTSNAVQEFLKPGDIGRELQRRLQIRADDPNIDNWQFDLFTSHVHLKPRLPINPFLHFFGCHLEGKFQHSQAERAAVISAAAFHFKQRLETGAVDQDHLNEQPLCMSSLEWLFNSSRKPRTKADCVQRFPNNNYLVALRHGHTFKIALEQKGKNVSYTSLKNVFQVVLDRSCQKVPSVATLTADNRDSWAEVHSMPSNDET